MVWIIFHRFAWFRVSSNWWSQQRHNSAFSRDHWQDAHALLSGAWPLPETKAHWQEHVWQESFTFRLKFHRFSYIWFFHTPHILFPTPYILSSAFYLVRERIQVAWIIMVLHRSISKENSCHPEYSLESVQSPLDWMLLYQITSCTVFRVPCPVLVTLWLWESLGEPRQSNRESTSNQGAFLPS